MRDTGRIQQHEYCVEQPTGKIVRDLQDTTAQRNAPSIRTPSQSPEGFSLQDGPTSTPAPPTPPRPTRTTPSGFPLSEGYIPEGYKLAAKPCKRVSIAPVPEGDMSVKPTFLGGIDKEEDSEEEEPRNQADDDTIADMESRVQQSLQDEDKDKAKIALPRYSGNRGNNANSWVVAMENYILYYQSKFQDK